MSDIPRGKYIGKRIGGEPADERDHFYKCDACGDGLISATSAWCWTRKDHCRTRRKINRSRQSV